MTHQLAELRSGGRFNPRILEDLHVVVDKKSNETMRLGDIAQVVSRGRHVNIIMSDEDVRDPPFFRSPMTLV